MKALLVIDMQEDYMGSKRNKKRYPYDTKSLIDEINKRIKLYEAENVFYITNRFFWEIGKAPKRIVGELHVVSHNIFEKRKQSCFSNKELLKKLKDMQVKEIEITVVDGNYCVGSSALHGITFGFNILFNSRAVGIGNMKKFNHIKHSLMKADVSFI